MTGVYQSLPPWLGTRKIFLVQPIEHWKITLVEGEEIINEDGVNAEILYTFFSIQLKS